MLHAHVDTYAVDCDGPVMNGYVMTMNDSEKKSDFGDIEFHGRVIASVVNTYSLFNKGTLEVTATGNGAQLNWSERTEEGMSQVFATICDADCDTEGNTYHRDIRAEEAGY